MIRILMIVPRWAAGGASVKSLGAAVIPAGFPAHGPVAGPRPRPGRSRASAAVIHQAVAEGVHNELDPVAPAGLGQKRAVDRKSVV